MVATPLASPDDVADLWRTLTPDEELRVGRLITKASAMLRQRLPWVDARIARFATDPTDPGGLDPETVSAVVATIVKRFLSNVQGVASEGIGPYSVTYAIRGEKDVRGEMYVTDGDLDKLKVPSKTATRIGTIKAHPRLAPWPFGDVGSPSLSGGSSMDLWLLDQMGSPGELPYYAGEPTDPSD